MQYDFKLGANGGQQIDVVGSFLKYKSGIGAIRVVTSKGAYIDLVPGQGVWGVDFTRLTVTDRSGVANSGVLLAGNYDFRDQTIPGVVSVADGGVSWTLNQNCFIGSVKTGASAAPVHNVGSLYNPVGSGKNIVVKSMLCYALSGAEIDFYVQAAYTPPGGGVNAKNKKLGASDSLAVLTADSTTYPSSAPIGVPMMTQPCPTGTPFQNMTFAEPVVIPPGYALIFHPGPGASGGQSGTVTFDFREDAA
jgi:hypothetical protein